MIDSTNSVKEARRLPSAPARAGLNAVLLLLIAAGVAVLAGQWMFDSTARQTPRDIAPVTGLNPQVAEKSDQLIHAARNAGIAVVITDEYRSSKEQDALYRKGRGDGGQVVTNARGGESYHNYGLAIDFALRTKAGKIVWDMQYDGNRNGRPDWMEVVAIAKKLGFDWGGDFRGFPDYPHLQMDLGLSIGELQRGERPPQPRASATAANQAGSQ